jgi:type II secretory pathway predicted ATPase ExeA
MTHHGHEQGGAAGTLADPDLLEDLAKCIALKAAVCVTSAVPDFAARMVLALMAHLGHQRPVVVDAPAAGTFAQFLDVLYTSLNLDRRHGPRPRERAETYRRIEREVQRRNLAVLVVSDADALASEALGYLASLEGHDQKQVPLVLVGSPRLVATAHRVPALEHRVYAWHPLAQ